MQFPSPHDVPRLCERIETRATASYTAAAPPEVAGPLGIALERVGSGVATLARGADVLMYNRVVGLGVDEPARPDHVDQALRWYERARVPRFMIQVAPCAEPAGLEPLLAARGFTRHNVWLRLWRDTTPLPPPPTDLALGPIEPAHADAFARVELEAFGHSQALAPWLAATVGRTGWLHFGGFDAGTLVAVGALFVEDDLAWMGFGATLPSHRGRGAQSALIAFGIGTARARGARLIAAETAADTPEKPNPSTHNLERLGFRLGYERPNWVRRFSPTGSGG